MNQKAINQKHDLTRHKTKVKGKGKRKRKRKRPPMSKHDSATHRPMADPLRPKDTDIV